MPVWGLLPSAAAPVLLVGGWTLAAALQPGTSAGDGTISELAGAGAAYPAVMTVALAGTGACHLATATALRPARRAGRMLLATGGVATAAVAALPLPATGGSVPHAVAAAVAFGALAVWPLGAATRSGAPPVPLLRRTPRLAACAVLLTLLAWFGAELVTGGPRVGAAERVAAGAQAVWPLLVVLSGLAAAPRSQRG